MNTKVQVPHIKLSQPTTQYQSSLVDSMMNRAQKNLNEQGIYPGQDRSHQSNWSAIDAIYEEIRHGIYNASVKIVEIMQLLTRLPVGNHQEMLIRGQTSIKDMEVFTTRVLSIKNRHAGFAGAVKDGAELALANGVYNDYVILQQQLTATLFPTMIALTQYENETLSVLRREVNKQLQEEMAAANADALNPNVITDVEFKEGV